MTFVTLAMSDVFGNYIPCSILLPNFYGFSGEWSYFKDKFELLVDKKKLSDFVTCNPWLLKSVPIAVSYIATWQLLCK